MAKLHVYLLLTALLNSKKLSHLSYLHFKTLIIKDINDERYS